ncbi:MAG: nitrogen fixation protein NifQ [Methylohalobius sp. ZOD2]
MHQAAAMLSENAPVEAVHARLIGLTRGLPNDDLFARILASRACGQGVLPSGLGLTPGNYARMIARHFPGLDWPMPDFGDRDKAREEALLLDDLRRLLLSFRAGRDLSECWLADTVAAGCMGSDHLWQDLGLGCRADLSRLIGINFPGLSQRNDKDMKWKKFLYKQLCVLEDLNLCRAPSCEECSDYGNCFGPED